VLNPTLTLPFTSLDWTTSLRERELRLKWRRSTSWTSSLSSEAVPRMQPTHENVAGRSTATRCTSFYLKATRRTWWPTWRGKAFLKPKWNFYLIRVSNREWSLSSRLPKEKRHQNHNICMPVWRVCRKKRATRAKVTLPSMSIYLKALVKKLRITSRCRKSRWSTRSQASTRMMIRRTEWTDRTIIRPLNQFLTEEWLSLVPERHQARRAV